MNNVADYYAVKTTLLANVSNDKRSRQKLVIDVAVGNGFVFKRFDIEPLNGYLKYTTPKADTAHQAEINRLIKDAIYSNFQSDTWSNTPSMKDWGEYGEFNGDTQSQNFPIDETDQRVIEARRIKKALEDDKQKALELEKAKSKLNEEHAKILAEKTRELEQNFRG